MDYDEECSKTDEELRRTEIRWSERDSLIFMATATGCIWLAIMGFIIL